MPSDSLVIVAARRVLATPLRAILRDWASLGLIHPVLLVDLDQHVSDIADLPALEVDEAGARMVRLQDRIADATVDRVRLGVLSFTAGQGSVSGEQAQALAAAVSAGLPYAALVRVAITVGAPEANFADAIPNLIDWQSMVLSPEDSLSPLQGATDLRPSFDAPQWHLHVAGAATSILGLWRGQSDAVVDDDGVASDGSVMPVRVFSRSVASDEIETELRERLVALGDRYPTPRVENHLAVAVDNEPAAAAQMASALLTKHQDVLPRKRNVAPAPPAKEIGFGEALRQFFAFMMAALKNAPRAFAEHLVRSAARVTAGAVDHLVYGSGSGFVVVARGVRADGSPAGWDEIEEQLDQTLRHQGNDLGVLPQQAQLWRDYVGGGLTLLDAGRHAQDLPPVTLGATSAVITNTAMVAPAPNDFYELPGHIGAYLPNWRLEVADDVGANRLAAGLDNLARSNPQLAHEISGEKQRLHQWYQQNSQSYVGRIGSVLGDAFRATTQEIESLEKRVEELKAIPDFTEDIAEDQRRLAKKFRFVGAGGLLLVLATIALIVFNVLVLLVGAVLVVAILVGTLVTGCLLYMRGQRRLYQFIHRKEQAASALETAVRHRTEALEDLRRLVRVYRQYLDWSRAFGAFVHAPLGSVDKTEVAGLSIGQGMPRSIRLGVAQLDSDVLDEVLGSIRRDLFRAGWLGAAWDEYLGAVPAELGQQRYAIQSDPTMLDRDPNPDGAGPILTRWSQAVSRNAAGRPTPREFLSRADEVLAGNPVLRDRLLSEVAFRDSVTGELKVMSRLEFEQGLEVHEAQGRFRHGLISRSATNIDAPMVRRSVPQSQFAGLAHATVLVQFGHRLDRSSFWGQQDTFLGEPAPGQADRIDGTVRVPATQPYQADPFSLGVGGGPGTDRNGVTSNGPDAAAPAGPSVDRSDPFGFGTARHDA